MNLVYKEYIKNTHICFKLGQFDLRSRVTEAVLPHPHILMAWCLISASDSCKFL
jgi:hypothetical protein